MKVAIICEESAVVREAFAKRGHHAVSYDLMNTRKLGPHIVGDCLAHDLSGYDLLICHPPCTYLCQSGVRWLYEEPMRWALMEAACGFFNAMLRLPCEMIAVENPRMHPHALKRIGPSSQKIQPWQFGHGVTKETHLWLKGLPPLVLTDVVDGRKGECHTRSPSKTRSRDRSVTYAGIAEAMAEQWESVLK